MFYFGKQVGAKKKVGPCSKILQGVQEVVFATENMIRLHFSPRWRLIYGSKLEVQMQRPKSDWREQKSNQCSSSQCTERTAIAKFTSSMCSSLSWQKFTLYSLRLLHFSKSLQIKKEKNAGNVPLWCHKWNRQFSQVSDNTPTLPLYTADFVPSISKHLEGSTRHQF